MRLSLLLSILFFSSCATSKQEAKPDTQSAAVPLVRPQSEIIAGSTSDDWMQLDPEYTLYLNVPDGQIVIALSSQLAKNHVAQIKTLAREGFFDGLTFYRVIEGFVAQAGPRGGENSLGSASDSLKAEFDEPIPNGLSFVPLGSADGYADEAGFVDGLTAARDIDDNRVWLTHCAGALAFARSTSANSAAATIYLTLQPQRYLDRNLTVVGRVVWGMEHVQAINRASPESGGVIDDADQRTRILSMTVAADSPSERQRRVELLDTNSEAFAELIDSRRNRPEAFFYHRPNHIDLCQMPIPVRRAPDER